MNTERMDIRIVGQDDSGSAFASLTRNAKEAKRVIDTMQGGLASISGGNVGGLASLGTQLSKIAVPAAVIAGIAAVGLAAFKAHEQLSQLGQDAESLGVRAADVEALQRAISMTGGDADKAAPALRNMLKEVDAAITDGGYLADLFKANNKSLTDSSGNLKSLGSLYRDISGLIRDAGSETVRLRIATAAFGEDAAPSMARAIVSGADALETLRKGGGSLDELVAKARDLDRVFQDMGRDVKTFANELSDAIRDRAAPAIKFLYDRTVDMLALLGSQSAKQSQFVRIGNQLGFPTQRLAQTPAELDAVYKGFNFNTTKEPAKAEPRNALDRAMDAVSKHIALMEADTQAIGKTSGAHEALRVKYELLEAAQRAGIPVTDALTKKIGEYAQRASAAADALANAKLENDLKFERDQLGRGPTEQAVAQRLRAAGIDPASAMGQARADEIRLNEGLKLTRDLATDAFKGMLSDLRAGKSALDIMYNAVDRIVSRPADRAIDNLAASLIGGVGKSGGAGLLSVFGFHEGGMVGIDGARRYVHPAYFENAPRLHSGGMIGSDEVPAVLRKGEVVLTPEQQAARGGSSDVNINVTVTGARGNSEIHQMVAAGVSTGLSQYDQALPGRIHAMNKRGI